MSDGTSATSASGHSTEDVTEDVAKVAEDIVDVHALTTKAAKSTSTAVDAALTYGLGEEWMRNGFLGVVQGIPVFEMKNAMLPGQVNGAGGMVMTDTNAYIAARVGDGYAPIYIGVEEGTPITLELTPRETADMTLNVNMTASLDVKPVFASKMGLIKNIS